MERQVAAGPRNAEGKSGPCIIPLGPRRGRLIPFAPSAGRTFGSEVARFDSGPRPLRCTVRRVAQWQSAGPYEKDAPQARNQAPLPLYPYPKEADQTSSEEGRQESQAQGSDRQAIQDVVRSTGRRYLSIFGSLCKVWLPSS